MGVEHLAQRKEKFLPRKVCAFSFAVAVVVHMFVCSTARKGVCDGDG